MRIAPWIALIFALFSSQASAALPFSCQASGDSWRIFGGSDRKATCSLVCILTDGRGDQDHVSCVAAVSGSAKKDPVCEGFVSGRHWTAGTLVSGQCAYSDP
jgi:hypothetical protein